MFTPFTTKLLEWYATHARDLPWRGHPDAYAVWISEIMLQQTQASVVIPYFNKWMEQYPTIEELAKAPLDAIIKSWEGLGYYARARNIHAAARYLVAHHRGSLPSDKESLKKIIRQFLKPIISFIIRTV